MAANKKEYRAKNGTVRFFIELPDASDVRLAGDFNNWDNRKHPMKNDGNGGWEKVIKAPMSTNIWSMENGEKIL